jgi:hypothetical protein
MSTITSTSPTLPLLPLASPVVYRMTVDEYERIADALDAPVELIDGYLVERTDRNPPHVLVSERLRRRLDRLVGQGWFVREDKPVRIPDFDEPRPDLAMVRAIPRPTTIITPGRRMSRCWSRFPKPASTATKAASGWLTSGAAFRSTGS